MKSNAERQKAYRERKKAEKAAESDLQAPIDQAPESAMQAPDSELQERYRKELQPEPVLEELQQQPIFEWQAPSPCVVEGHPDDLSPVKLEPETITYFDVYKRRHYRFFQHTCTRSSTKV